MNISFPNMSFVSPMRNVSVPQTVLDPGAALAVLNDLPRYTFSKTWDDITYKHFRNIAHALPETDRIIDFLETKKLDWFAAVQSVGKLNNIPTLNLFLNILDFHGENLRAFNAPDIGCLSHPKIKLIIYFEELEAQLQRVVAETLGKFGRFAVPRLIEELERPEQDALKLAALAKALSIIRDPRAAEPLFKVLRGIGETERWGIFSGVRYGKGKSLWDMRAVLSFALKVVRSPGNYDSETNWYAHRHLFGSDGRDYCRRILLCEMLNLEEALLHRETSMALREILPLRSKAARDLKQLVTDSEEKINELFAATRNHQGWIMYRFFEYVGPITAAQLSIETGLPELEVENIYLKDLETKGVIEKLERGYYLRKDYCLDMIIDLISENFKIDKALLQARRAEIETLAKGYLSSVQSNFLYVGNRRKDQEKIVKDLGLVEQQ